ncbi:MAG: hypothetical protein ACLP1X_00095, partial [Polyangiaceae bacterium]
MSTVDDEADAVTEFLDPLRSSSLVVVILALPVVLAGCPALLSDWTISGNGTDGASADAPSPDATGGGASS